MTTKLTLSKRERLKSSIIMEQLFSSGNSIKSGPFVLLWSLQKLSSSVPIQVAFSVPKKKFKKAVTRNKIRRLVKEAYRLHKTDLFDTVLKSEKQLALFILYRDNNESTQKELQDKIIVALSRLENELIIVLSNAD
ncbi:MAG: ribonuclease P protein component [Flavobacteriales bacterium]|nr:ribonuclease P protein component [Flavobacteriales bacterium]